MMYPMILVEHSAHNLQVYQGLLESLGVEWDAFLLVIRLLSCMKPTTSFNPSRHPVFFLRLSLKVYFLMKVLFIVAYIL